MDQEPGGVRARGNVRELEVFSLGVGVGDKMLTSLIFSRWARTGLWGSVLSALVPRTGWRRRLRNASKSNLRKELMGWARRHPLGR